VTVEELNGLDRQAFTQALDGIWEGSPWVAAEAWDDRPFAGREALLAAMVAVVGRSPEERRLALVRAHPELAGIAARAAALSAESSREQAGAGLDSLDGALDSRLAAVNVAYRDRFGFPAVIRVRGRGPEEIVTTLEERLGHARGDELTVALAEIGDIARLRLEERVDA
jgi:2-oxo-4-hydroxy-4-carboxy-5-ureidoimidazoline decarboxylase